MLINHSDICHRRIALSHPYGAKRNQEAEKNYLCEFLRIETHRSSMRAKILLTLITDYNVLQHKLIVLFSIAFRPQYGNRAAANVRSVNVSKVKVTKYSRSRLFG